MLNRAARTARRVQLTRACINQSIINAPLIGCCQGHLSHKRAHLPRRFVTILMTAHSIVLHEDSLVFHWSFVGNLIADLRFYLPERFSLWSDFLLSRKKRCSYHKNASKLLVPSKRHKRQPWGYDLPPWLHVLHLPAVSFLKKQNVGLRRLFCVAVKKRRISAQTTSSSPRTTLS